MSLAQARRSGVYPSAATQNARTAATSAASRKSWAKRGSPGSAVAPSSRAAVWRLSGEVGEVELEAVGVVHPLVLAAVEDHEPGAQVDQQREARVVGQRRRCGGQVTLLRRRGGAVARHRAEHRLPVGRPGPLAERVARHQVDLVAVGVGVTDPVRSRRLTKTRLLDRRGRPHHVEVDAVAQRPWLGRLPDPDRGVAPQRIRQTAVLRRRVVERALPERPHRRRVRGLEHDAQVLQHGRVRGQPELPRGRRHRLGVLVRVEAHPHAGRAQVDHDLGRQLHDAPGQRSPLDQRRRVEPCRRNAVDHPPVRSDLCHARHCRTRLGHRPSGRRSCAWPWQDAAAAEPTGPPPARTADAPRQRARAGRPRRSRRAARLERGSDALRQDGRVVRDVPHGWSAARTRSRRTAALFATCRTA